MARWLVSNLQWIFSGIGVVILLGLGNLLLRLFRRKKVPIERPALNGFSPRPTRQGRAEVEILPLSFEAALSQEIPHLEIWLYVVNYLPEDLSIQSLKIPHFNFTGGPSIDDITCTGEPNVPACRSSPIILRRPLIDSEVRAIERSQRTNPANASFVVLIRGTAGRKHPGFETEQLSSNGWIRGIPLHI